MEDMNFKEEKHLAHSFSHEELEDLLTENWEVR